MGTPSNESETAGPGRVRARYEVHLRRGGGTSDRETMHQEKTVHCERHGDRRQAFLCGHLLRRKNLGFFFDMNDRSNPHPDAWCGACERRRQEDGGQWSDASEAALDVRLVCGDCYEEIKVNNIIELQMR